MKTSVIHTADPRMRRVLEVAENVAASRASVLILGESGTGKELLARYIHSKSPRSDKRFVALNCAAVPESLLESELFGYEKGAFTGADSRKSGKFEQADGSSFLLDEVGEMSLPLQAKLLRVIQESEIERVGGSSPIPVNFRLIAATHRTLPDMVREGSFREDLFYRLNVIPLEIPPLRERSSDITLLSHLFIEMSCAANGLPIKSFSPEAEKKMLSWGWPGNIRELQNVVERSVLMAPGEILTADEVIIDNYSEAAAKRSLGPGMTVSEAERVLILNTLDYTQQNRTQAAHLLGISIRTLRNKINEYKAGNYL